MSKVRFPTQRQAPTYAELRNDVISSANRYAKQIVLPNDVSNPLVLPADTESMVCARTIRRNFVVTSDNISPSGEAIVYIPADLFNPGFVSTALPTLIPVNPGHLNFTAAHAKTVGTSDGSVKPVVQINDMEGVKVVKTSFHPMLFNGVTHYGVPITSVGAVGCSYHVSRPSGLSIKAWRIGFAWATAAGWTWFGHTTSSMSVGQVANGTFTFPANATAFAYAVLDDSKNPMYGDSSNFDIDVSVTFGTGDADQAQYVGGATMPLYKSIEPFVISNEMTRGRLTAMSVLATNATADIYKQGEVFAARIPVQDIREKGGSLDSTIRRLPANRQYIGPAANGAYVWWYPSTEPAGMVLQISDAANALSKEDVLLIYFKGLDPAAGRTSINLQLAFTCEGFTEEQTFEKIPTPPQL